ncbi:MAG: class I SAM-dependent methyltransferase [Chitinophagaceae bacterium]|nr:class I SAM-dependent methyltransferase [Chitinophagaceae bacterium]
MKVTCPICKSSSLNSLLQVAEPTLQNRVYETAAEANAAVQGQINLTHCNACNFTFNAAFDESIIVYDEKYDNAVPSKLFIEYYHNICHYLFKKYDLEKGIVYDVGCGKGTFLKILCNLYPQVKGVGIDPSYEGDLNPTANLTFIRDFFKTEHVLDKPSLILSRHVFEHIEYPKEFLSIIREPLQAYQDIPFFIEVPDFGWIVENQTFWDICYEHCNYFSPHALANMCKNDWSQLTSITPSFGDQYLWVEGVFNGKQHETTSFKSIDQNDLDKFVHSIESSQKNIADIIQEHKSQGSNIIVWGMATKGVIFSNKIDLHNQLIDHCIDINKEKQHKYSPISAHYIESPEVLTSLAGMHCLIIIMNTNYVHEIKAEVASMNIQAKFIDAHGRVL